MTVAINVLYFAMHPHTVRPLLFLEPPHTVETHTVMNINAPLSVIAVG
jgi:hypothetical protein